ncbi:MAG: response regulator [Candidatus Korobacteraceae bacterium]
MILLKTSKRSLRPLVAVASVGILVSIILFFSFRAREKHNAEAVFERFAQDRFDRLEGNVARNLNDVVALGSFFDVSQTINRVEFGRLTKSLLETNDALQALEWVPKVPKALRKSYEDTAHREGQPSFEVTECLPSGIMGRAAERQDYAPVFFVEPLKRNEKAVGFDLLSNSERRATIQHSTDSGRLQATGRIVLEQETADQYGVLIFRPVYRYGAVPSSTEERRKLLAGFVLGVFRMGDIVERAVVSPGTPAPNVGLVIQDLDAPPAEQSLYSKRGDLRSSGELRGQFRSGRTISVADRSWRVEAFSLPGTFAVKHWGSWIVLVAGLSLTGLLAAYLRLSLNRQSAIEQIVSERTGSLHAALTQLEDSEARYRKLLDLSPDAIIVGRNQSITFANRAAVEMFKVNAASELVGRRVADFAGPQQQNLTKEAVQQMYACEMQLPVQEGQLHRPDGSLLDVEVAASSFPESDGLVVQAVLRNITQRKQAEAERTRLIRCIEQVGESIVITNLDGSILYVNPAFEKLTGYSRDEAIGRNPRILKSGHHSEAFYQEMWATLLRGDTWSGEVINRRKDASLFQEEATIAPIKNKDGMIANFVAVKRDITLRKQAEAELEQARNKAEAANRAKSDFLANMSHEIRTPMNGIIGMTDLALETDLTPEQREFLGMVKSSADSLLSLINDILDFSRIEAGKLDVESIDFLLRDSLDDTIKSLGFRAAQKGIELACRVLPEVPDRLQGDPSRMRQILVNLVGNAVKFTTAGEVLVEVEVQEKADDNVLLHFSVRDTGVGIAPEKQLTIFEAFTQADNSMTRKFGGTGLGLSISSRLVKIMGGRIWVESIPGQGSTFHFTSRFRMQQPSTRPHGYEPASAAFPRHLSVLVVDDNTANRRILEEMLLGWGMVPTLAEDGSEALSLLEQASAHQTPYALVLLDVRMPGIDGFGIAQSIKLNSRISKPAIIMLGSVGLRRDSSRFQELGIAAHLNKPIKRSELLQVIEAALSSAPFDGPQSSVDTLPLQGERRKHLKILLVEDDRVNQAFAVRILQKEGHVVTLAENGIAALQALEQQGPDCILMDVHMPEMDGFQATAAIRESELRSGRHVPIVAMTANAMAGDKERCLAAGMDGYVSKPLRPEDLFFAIEECVHAIC